MKTYKYNNVILISDIHFGVHSNSDMWIDIQNQYFEKFFIPYIKKNKNKNTCCFILGDVFDNRQSINVKVLDIAKKIMRTISSIMDVFILVGNHDIYYTQKNDVTSVDVFDKIKNITIFKEPEVVMFSDKKILVIPWRKSVDDMKTILTQYNTDYVFAHTDINGFKLNSARVIDYGVKPTVFNKFKRVFSGHIHLRQEHKNIIMCGNPHHTTRTDINNKKGIYTLNVSNNKTTFIENNFSPEYVRINIVDFLDCSVQQLKKHFTNKIVDIDISQNYFIVSRDAVHKFITTLDKICLKLYTHTKQKVEKVNVTIPKHLNIKEFIFDAVETLEIDNTLKILINTEFDKIFKEVISE